MAGSYMHCRGPLGKFRFDLIDNLGDAYEACKEMFEMIEILTGGDKNLIADAINGYLKRINPGIEERHLYTADRIFKHDISNNESNKFPDERYR